MILNALIGVIRDVVVWVMSLMPVYHIDDSTFLSAVTDVWVQAYTWSGVIPVNTVLHIIELGMILGTALLAFNVFMMAVNLVRGSGA